MENQDNLKKKQFVLEKGACAHPVDPRAVVPDFAQSSKQKEEDDSNKH